MRVRWQLLMSFSCQMYKIRRFTLDVRCLIDVRDCQLLMFPGIRFERPSLMSIAFA